MRYIEADEELSMGGKLLREAIEDDIKQGLVPFWVSSISLCLSLPVSLFVFPVKINWPPTNAQLGAEWICGQRQLCQLRALRILDSLIPTGAN